MAISDYIRVPGSARKYKNKKTGEIISRWKFDTLKSGGINPKEKAKIRKTQGVRTKNTATQHRLNGFINAYKVKQAQKTGGKVKDIKVRGNTADAIYFRRLYKQLKIEASKKPLDRSPNGPLAQILVKLGLRDPEWQYPVGHSPT